MNSGIMFLTMILLASGLLGVVWIVGTLLVKPIMEAYFDYQFELGNESEEA